MARDTIQIQGLEGTVRELLERLRAKDEEIAQLSSLVEKGDELMLLDKRIEAAQLQLHGLESLVTAATTVMGLQEKIGALREEEGLRREIVQDLSDAETTLRTRLAALRDHALAVEGALATVKAHLGGETPLSQREIDQELDAARSGSDDSVPPAANAPPADSSDA